MVYYNIPEEVIESFCQKAGTNKNIETLAYLVGFKDNDTQTITVSDMVFPQQKGTPVECEDLGMHIYN